VSFLGVAAAAVAPGLSGRCDGADDGLAEPGTSLTDVVRAGGTGDSGSDLAPPPPPPGGVDAAVVDFRAPRRDAGMVARSVEPRTSVELYNSHL